MKRLLICISSAVLLALGAAGCGSANVLPTPTLFVPPTNTVLPTAAATPTLIPGGDPDAPPTYTYTGTGIDQFGHSTAHVLFAFMGNNEAGQPANVSSGATIVQQRDPLSLLVDMNHTGSGLGTAATAFGSSFSILVANDTTYITLNQGMADEACVSQVGGGAAAQFAALTSTDDLIGTSVPDMQYVEPNQVMNGVESRHYRLENFVGGQFTNGTLDVWVARDGGYVTRVIVNGNGTFPGYGTGLLTMTYDLTSTVATVDFAPPLDCAPAEVPGG